MSATTLRPSWLGRSIVALRPLGDRRAEIEADLLELFRERVELRGAGHARRRYILDGLSLWIHRQPRAAAGRAGLPPRTFRLEGVFRDIVFAARLYRRQWGIVAVTVGSLGLAIGVCTAVFSGLNAMYLRPLGVGEPAGAIRVWRTHRSGASQSWSFAEYLATRERVRSVTLEAVIQGGIATGDNIAGSSDVGFASIGLVSGTFFTTFGGEVKAGRLIGPADDTAEAPLVAVVNYYFWIRQFGGDRAIVGRVVRLGQTPVRIVGVAARWFTGPEEFGRDFWLPLAPASVVWPKYGPIHASSTAMALVTGQVARGQTIEQATTELSAILRSVSESGVPTTLPPATGVDTSSADGRNVEEGQFNTNVAMAAISLVLLLASVNVANLLLASGAGRGREMAVRLALGATRRRLARQLLTESLALAVLAGLVGLTFAIWLTPSLARLVGFGSDAMMFAPDGRVYLFLAAASLTTGLVAGFAPARAGTKGDALSPVRGDGMPGVSPPPARRLRSLFVGLQAAASIVLLVLSALLVRALLHATTVDLGYPSDRLINAGVGLPFKVDPTLRSSILTAAVNRLRALPGVEAAALVYALPLAAEMHAKDAVLRSGEPYFVTRNLASPEYFATAGLRFVRGRSFTSGETGTSVAVITEKLARDFWGESDPVGTSLSRVDPKRAGTQVVGVIADAITYRLQDPYLPTIYYPLSTLETNASILVRVREKPETVLAPIQSALRAVHPMVSPYAHLTTRPLRRAFSEAEMMATLGGLAGGLALALAVIGIFGVTAFVIGQRTREIGLRIAIGASTSQVTQLLLRDGLRPVVIGLGTGLIVALASGQVLAGVMYGISPRDPIAIVAAVVVLLAAGTAAILIPARRAARVDPATVLRQS